MGQTMRQSADPRHLLSHEVSPVMAKASLKNVETSVLIGRALVRCFALAGLSQKEAAALIGRDPAQVARWIAATERPQVDAIFAVQQLRRPLVIALAELAGDGVEVTTSIRITG